MRRDGFGLRQGCQCAALREHRRAGCVELDQLADVQRHLGRKNQVAQAPAGHEEGFREALRDHQPVLRLGDVQKAGRRAGGRVVAVVQALVHLVRENPRARGAAVRQDGRLLLVRQRPAGGVVGRIDDQQACSRRDGGQQRRQVQLPGPLCVGLQRHAAQARPHDQRLRGQVGPDGRDGHHLIPGVDQRLHGDDQGVHATRGDGDAVGRNGMPVRPVQAGAIGGHGIAQRRQPQVVAVKGLARLQRCDGRVAHRVGRRFVALAEPEGQHIRATHACVGHFPDLGLFEVENGLTHETDL